MIGALSCHVRQSVIETASYVRQVFSKRFVSSKVANSNDECSIMQNSFDATKQNEYISLEFVARKSALGASNTEQATGPHLRKGSRWMNGDDETEPIDRHTTDRAWAALWKRNMKLHMTFF